MSKKNKIEKIKVLESEYNKSIEGKIFKIEHMNANIVINKPRKPSGSRDPNVKESRLQEVVQETVKTAKNEIIEYVDKRIDEVKNDLKEFKEEVNKKFDEVIELIKNKYL